MKSMTVLQELNQIIHLLEAEIPANPQSPKNQRLQKRLERLMAGYFRSLADAFPYHKLGAIYNRNVVTEAMTPSDWKAEYQKGVPHWAEGMKPSVFAREFSKLMKEYEVDSVLEIGCGNGRDSIHFAKSGFRVASIDIVPKAVELAKGNAEKEKTTVTFKVANAEKLPFDDSSFGAVFSLSVLHSTNLKNSLPEVIRVLEADGLAFIYIYGDTQYQDDRATEDKIKWSDYLETLKNLGFRIVKSYTEQEEKFDEFGEKHRLFVVQLQKEQE